MAMEVKINFQDSAELAEFARWWDSRNNGRSTPTVAEPVKIVQFDPPIAKDRPLVTTPNPVAEPVAEPVAKTVEPSEVMMTPDAFQVAVKRWFAEDPQPRALIFKQIMESLKVEKISDIPADQFVKVLMNLGVA